MKNLQTHAGLNYKPIQCPLPYVIIPHRFIEDALLITYGLVVLCTARSAGHFLGMWADGW